MENTKIVFDNMYRGIFFLNKIEMKKKLDP